MWKINWTAFVCCLEMLQLTLNAQKWQQGLTWGRQNFRAVLGAPCSLLRNSSTDWKKHTCVVVTILARFNFCCILSEGTFHKGGTAIISARLAWDVAWFFAWTRSIIVPTYIISKKYLSKVSNMDYFNCWNIHKLLCSLFQSLLKTLLILNILILLPIFS